MTSVFENEKKFRKGKKFEEKETKGESFRKDIKKLRKPEKQEKKIPKDPNKKPNTKVFDVIGDVLKTPFIMRGGKDLAKGGRVGYRKGGGICKKGMNRQAIGKNS